MNIQISPNIKANEVGPLTLDRKIEIFIDRMNGWMFDSIHEIDRIEFSGKSIMLLKMSVTTVKLLAKYISGELSKASKHYYISGLKTIFPSFNKPGNENDGELFYQSIRNPLYHLGFPSPNVFISFDVNFPFAIKEHLLIQINPRVFSNTVERKFQSFLSALANPNNKEIRDRFEARFDFDHDEIFNSYLGKDYFNKLKNILGF